MPWPTSRNKIRRNHIERITMKTHWKNQVLQVCFFLFNLFHQYCTSVHFWWPVQDIVVLNDFEMLWMNLHKTKHSAAGPPKIPFPSYSILFHPFPTIPGGKSQLCTCSHPLSAQPSQQPGLQQSKISFARGVSTSFSIHPLATLSQLVKTWQSNTGNDILILSQLMSHSQGFRIRKYTWSCFQWKIKNQSMYVFKCI